MLWFLNAQHYISSFNSVYAFDWISLVGKKAEYISSLSEDLVWWGVFLLVILDLLAGIDSLMIFSPKVRQSSSLREI